jgi:hypothetical protein
MLLASTPNNDVLSAAVQQSISTLQTLTKTMRRVDYVIKVEQSLGLGCAA